MRIFKKVGVAIDRWNKLDDTPEGREKKDRIAVFVAFLISMVMVLALSWNIVQLVIKLLSL